MFESVLEAIDPWSFRRGEVTHLFGGINPYKYLEPVCPLFWGLNPPKEGRNFNENKGHVGSRYKIYGNFEGFLLW